MQIRLLSILALLLALVVGPATAQDTIRLSKYAGNLKQAAVKIGSKYFHFLFDTGGGETFISPEVAAALGRKPYGGLPVYRMSGEKLEVLKCDSVTLQVGRQQLAIPTVAVWDLMSILPKELPRLDGVISLKTFKDRVIVLDLSRNQLIVQPSTYVEKQQKKLSLIPARFANGLAGNELSLFVQVMKNKRPYWFLFDSGNLNDVLLSAWTAREWNVINDTAENGRLKKGIDLSLGKFPLTTAAAVQPILYDGALNFATLQQHVFVIDLVRYRLYKRL